MAKDKLKSLLTERGMFDEQAEAVLSEAIPQIEALVPGYKIAWSSPAEDYPDQMYTVWWMSLKETALVWIDKNIPKAWFRPMFE